MSVLSLRRRPASVEADPDEEQVNDERSPIATGAHQTSTHLAARAATIALLGCLALGPLGFVAGSLAFLQTGSTQSTPLAPVADLTSEQAVVGEFAQRVVLTWLTATQDSPDALLALVKDAQLSTLPRQAFVAKDVTVARIEQVDGTWSVTVATTVTDARKVTARRFFQVPVRIDAGTVSALSLPAPVSPPSVAPASTTAYREPLGSASPQGQTVAQFLAAYLTGAGDVDRYLTPGVTLAALSPAPYTSVRLDDLSADTSTEQAGAAQDGLRIRVLAAATAAVTPQQSASVTYALTLTARAGRWEITAIDPAPAYTPRAAAADPAADPAPDSAETGNPAPSGTPPVSSTP